MLIFVQGIVNLPEFPLQPDGLGDLCRRFGVRVHVGEREVAKDETHRVGEVRAQLFHDWVRLTAVGTLIIAVFDDRKFGVEWSN